MKCPRCGIELNENARRCSGCGAKISKDKENVAKGNSDIYGKLFVLSAILFAAMFAVAFVFRKNISSVYAAISFVLVIAGYILRKKSMVLWVERLCIPAVVIAFLLIVPYVFSFSYVETDVAVFNWQDVVLKNHIPEPSSNYGNIYTNNEESLEIHVYKISSAKFSKYIKKSSEKGFNVDAIKEDGKYIAYNEEGYNLNLSYDSKYRKMEIKLQTPIELEQLNWSTMDVFEVVPKPESTLGKIETNIETEFSVYVGNTSFEKFKYYTDTCKQVGFAESGEQSDKIFEGENSEEYRIRVEYLGGNLMRISIKIPRYDVALNFICEENWIFSKYDVDVYFGNEKLFTLKHGSEKSETLSLKKGEYTLRFSSAEDSEMQAEKTFSVKGNMVLEINIKCTIFGPEISLQQ